ncbi:MAG: hypothetical protein DRP85_04405 [Candidatus Makaraimicrobium thalassicum]|nr:MAG: hypothetical protein DRP85_04405 [Candidatus Omnitrophota bacterium]
MVKMEKIKLNPLTLSFAGDLEKTFSENYFRRFLKQVRFAVLTGVFFYGISGVFEAQINPETRGMLWFIRYAVVCPFGLGILLFSVFRLFEGYKQVLLVGWAVAAGVGIIEMNAAAPPSMHFFYYTSLILILIITYTFLRIRFIWAASAGWFILAVYEIVAVRFGNIPAAVLENSTFFFISANVIGMAVCYSMEFYARKDFFQVHLLKDRHEKAEQKLQTAYNEVRETQKRLIQSAKMAAVGQFASGVAHEVKNPLSIIVQGIDYLERESIPANKDQAEVLKMIKEAVVRADKIVRRLLDFSSPHPLRLVPYEVTEVMRASFRMMKKQLALMKIKVTEDFTAGLPLIMIDEEQMKQVFINIILNSLHAMPEGGEITARIYAKDLTEVGNGIGRRASDLFKVGSSVLICEIKDTGLGIPGDELSKVSDPFFTTRFSQGGTGLGLTITRSIVERHGGIINIESKEGQGTGVTVILPIFKEGDQGGQQQ